MPLDFAQQAQTARLRPAIVQYNPLAIPHRHRRHLDLPLIAIISVGEQPPSSISFISP